MKTADAFGVYSMTAVTAVTAQNTTGVHSVHPVPAKIVRDQIAESHDLRPRDPRGKRPSLVGDLRRGLAYDDEVVENCITGLSVERASRNVTADGRDRFTYVAEAQSLAVGADAGVGGHHAESS